MEDLIIKKLLADKPNWFLVEFRLTQVVGIDFQLSRKFKLELLEPTTGNRINVESDSLNTILSLVKCL